MQSADGRVSLMVEPLLHFVVPFVSLRAVGLDLRKATFDSLITLTPDLDVVFNTHRSPAPPPLFWPLLSQPVSL